MHGGLSPSRAPPRCRTNREDNSGTEIGCVQRSEGGKEGGEGIREGVCKVVLKLRVAADGEEVGREAERCGPRAKAGRRRERVVGERRESGRGIVGGEVNGRRRSEGGGDPLILGGGREDEALDNAIQDHLVSFILDDFLAGAAQGGQVSRERIEALSEDFLEDYVRPLVNDLNDDDEEEQAILRQDAVRRALLEDYEGRQSLHARLLQGETQWETRRYLQAAFNRSGASPMVLIAQSQVGREGLNLHEACRVVVQFHAEWNPAVLEQQIGRVDRKGSLWEKKAEEWLRNGTEGTAPYIEVRQLIFEGTYDAFQWDRVMRRQQDFDASLFGTLLPPDVWHRVPTDRMQGLLEAAPCFRPPPLH